MIKNLYSIYDKLNGYLSPMIDKDDFTAQRNFKYALNNNELMRFVPTDYSLYYVGSFDDESGELTACIPPRFILNGSEGGM